MCFAAVRKIDSQKQVSVKALFRMKMTFKGNENFLLLSTPLTAEIPKGTRNGPL